jgi:hypothetical protein
LCAATPRADCVPPSASGRAKLQLRHSAVDGNDTLLWRWTKGSASLNQFGDPAHTTDYALCVYDRSAGVATLAQVATAPGGGVCAGVNCWKRLSRGFRYKNLLASDDGVRMLLLKEGQNDRAKLLLKGKGPNLALPAPFSGQEILDQDPSVTVQLVNTAGFCWEATYAAPAQSNHPDLFRDKSD